MAQGMIITPGKDVRQTDSYLAFCGAVNSNSLDSAFGKNNESKLTNIGNQLAMYAWFKGEDESTYPYTNLKQKKTLEDCLTDANSMAEIWASSNLWDLINTSPYALAEFNSTDVSNTIATLASLNADDYPTIASIIAVDATLNAIFADESARNLMIDNTTTFTAICNSGKALNLLVKSTGGKTRLEANLTKYYTYRATMIATMDGATTYFTKSDVSSNTSAYGNTTVTLGTTNSFVDVISMTDNVSNSNRNWTDIYHGHGPLLISHFTDEINYVGTHTIEKICIGGAKMVLNGTATTDMSWVANLYEAI